MINLSGELEMKKGLVLSSIGLAFGLLASTVAEARDGFYLTARGGKTWMNLNNSDDSVSKKSDTAFDPVAMYSGAVGYKYKYFRAEVEYVSRDGAEDETYGTYGWIDTTEVEANSVMLNAYIDFMPNYWISPYVTGGVGYSEVKFTHTSKSGSETIEDNKFSWQAGAGLTLRINKCLNLDGGYRYYTLGKIEDGEVNGHEWFVGIRFTF